MTDLPGGSIIAHGPFEIASLKPQPQYLTIGSLVRISLDTGAIEYGDSYTPDKAARTFWEAMSKAYGSAEAVFGHGLAARVDAEMAGLRRQIARIHALHERYRDVEAAGDKDSCAHCNQLAGHRVPWPCPTLQALEQP